MIGERNEVGKFSIEHPLGWTYIDTPNGSQGDTSIAAYIVTPSLPGFGVVVLIRRNTTGLNNLNAVQDWVKSLQPPTRHETQIRDAAHRIGNQETLEREYTWQSEQTDSTEAELIRCLDNYRLHDRDAYALSFCTQDTEFGRLKPTFEQMIASFEYLN